jgi:ABC-type phosphate transport system substrate-binding protein
MRGTFSILALVAVILVGLAGITSAREPAFKVIAHPKNPAASISRDFLRNAFLKKEVAWGNGDTLRPIDLSSKFAVREQFTRDVLKKTPAQLKAYWSQQVFSGKGVPPPEVSSAEDVIAYVLANPGAIGYIPADVDPSGAKVIEVR